MAVVDNNADFERWYRDVHPRLGAALAFSFGDNGLAEDAADEALARALERWDRVKSMTAPTGWVYHVAFNEALRRQRRRRFEARLMLGQRAELIEPPAGELWNVVADLPARQRQAVVLRHVGQLREVEIAEVMGTSRGAVSSTLRTAYQALRIALADPAPLKEAR